MNGIAGKQATPQLWQAFGEGNVYGMFHMGPAAACGMSILTSL